MNKKKWIIGSIAGVAVVGLIALLVIPAEIKKNQPPTVKTAQAVRGDVEQWYSATGKIRSNRVKTYSPGTGMSFQEVLVGVGDRVSEGQILARMDTTAYEKAVDQTETAYRTAEKGLKQLQNSLNEYQADLSSLDSQIAALKAEIERENQAGEEAAKQAQELARQLMKQMNRGGQSLDADQLAALLNAQSQSTANLGDKQIQLIGLQLQRYVREAQGASYSASSLDQMRETVDTAKAAYESAKSLYDEAKSGVTADFAGIVSEVGSGSSMLSSAGITVKSDSDLYAEIELGKYDIARVKAEQTAKITVPTAEFGGKVASVGAIAQVSSTLTGTSTSTVTAKIHIDNPSDALLIDYDCDVDILLGKDTDAVLVPVEAIRSDNGGSYCYLVEDGLVKRAAVELGYSSDTFTAVYAGVGEGDLVVNNPTADISDGARVTPETGKAG